MVSSLRRLYLYLVASAAFVFTTYALDRFIDGLIYNAAGFSQYPAYFNVPSMRQAVALLLVAVIIAVPIGAVHWWLIRREGKTDPTARANGVRAFFVSGLLIGYASYAISQAVSFLSSLGQQPPIYAGQSTVVDTPIPPFNYDALALLIAALIGLAAILLERRWTHPEAESEAARTVTAVLFGLAQIGWLIAALVSVAGFIQSVLDHLLQFYPTCHFEYPGPPTVGICQQPYGELRYVAIWAAGNIVGLFLFLWLPRRVRTTIVQQVVAGALAFTAIIFVIIGIQRLVVDFLAYVGGTGGDAYFGFGAGLVDTSNYYSGYGNTAFWPSTFVGPIVAGLLGLAAMWLWFTFRAGSSERATRGRAVYLFGLQLPLAFCLAYGLAGVIQFGLLNLLGGQGAVNGGALESFYAGVGLLVCALPWPALIYRLYRLGRGTESGAHQTWRIYLALVTSLSAVAALIGIAIAANALFSAVIGSALTNGLVSGTQGASIALGGLVVAISHAILWRRDHRAHPSQPTAAAPATPATTPATVPATSGGEDTLDAVLARVAAGSLSPDAAGQLLRSRYHLE